MNSFLDFIVYGTFGSPHGFQQSIATNRDLEKGLSTFDLRGAIEIAPNSNMFSIKKQSVSGLNILSYTKNSFANEPGSKRRGSFIGAGILLYNALAEESAILESLNEFHLNLISNNIVNETINVHHSNEFKGLVQPSSIQNVFNSKRDLPDTLSFRETGNVLFVYCNITSKIFKKSIDLLNEYDTIHFTDNQEIAEYVQNKGLIPIVDEKGFEIEIQRVETERLRKIQNTIDELNNKIEEVKTAKLHFLENYQLSIQQLKNNHDENKKKIDEFEMNKDFHKENFYKFQQYIDGLVTELKSNGKIDTVRQRLLNATKIFNDAVAKSKIPDFKSIQSPQFNSNIKEPRNIKSKVDFNNQFYGLEPEISTRKKIFPLDLFKIISIFLTVLLIGSWVYFLFFNSPENNSVKKNQSKTEQIPQEIEKEND